MCSIHSYIIIKRILLSLVLFSFTLNYPLSATPQLVGLNEAVFMGRIEKLVQNLMKSKEKSMDKIIESFLKVKNEIESSYNLKINIDDNFNQLSKEFSKMGVKADKKQLEAIKKKIKLKEKKTQNKKKLCECFSAYDAAVLNKQLNVLCKREKSKENDEDRDEVLLPSALVYGVTVSLCGMFLMILPIPGCKDWGVRMVLAGVSACSGAICTKTDENNKEKQKNKR